MTDITHNRSNDIIEHQLNQRMKELEKVTGLDGLTFVGPLYYEADDEMRDAVESIPDKRSGLLVILETRGGYIEVTRRIASTLRQHYQHVEFIVPNYAMSAGTVLAMSGDAIHMDYYSVLGPIDPQVGKQGGEGFLPALGYLVQYERLLKKAEAGQLTDAELAILLRKFDPAELYQIEQERELSIELLKEWLVQYKFKDWTITETHQKPVTPEMREQRAGEIAELLNKTSRWHSHARGITMAILQNEAKLKINDFGANRDLSSAVKKYYRLLKDYMGVRSHAGVIHTRAAFTPF